MFSKFSITINSLLVLVNLLILIADIVIGSWFWAIISLIFTAIFGLALYVDIDERRNSKNSIKN